MQNSVSVIIPVYNAAGFVAQAVETALQQPETGEVILVEDASLDDSLRICQDLVEKYEKVHLHRHPGGANRGAGPSRNLGMEKSLCPFIAFLDADDLYLPGRFAIASKIFKEDPACEGVYEAVGICFEDEAGRERWLKSSMAHVALTTLNRLVAPEDLFRALVKGGSGHIHLNGLVIRRPLLDKTGYMDETIIAEHLHEDTDFILRAAAVGRLLPGRLTEPVALRRVHAENRVSAPRPPALVYRDHMRQRVATYRWCRRKRMDKHRRLAFRRMLDECIHNKPCRLEAETPRSAQAAKALRLLSWVGDYPEVVLEDYYWSELLGALWGAVRNPGSPIY